MSFFKTISTRSENSISGVFQNSSFQIEYRGVRITKETILEVTLKKSMMKVTIMKLHSKETIMKLHSKNHDVEISKLRRS